MKMDVSFATGVIVEGTTEDGKTVQIKSLSISPFFLTAKGHSELMSVKSMSDKDLEIEEVAFLVSGSTGKLAKKDRTAVAGVVVADIDKKTPPGAEAVPAPEDDADDEDEEDDFAETD